MLELKTTGEVIGVFDLRRAATTRLEFGYALARAFWRRGLMTEALADVADTALRLPSVWRIGAVADIENAASMRVMEKAGLRREGVLRRWLVHPNMEKARAKGFDKPLAWDGHYPTLGTRRAIQYGKGALFMDHLRTALGDRAFWSGLRRYTRAHAGGTVTSADLKRVMEAASGRDLRPIFAQWVFGTD